MKKSKIDLIIINNAPAFYKVNLYNEIAKKCTLHVIFLAKTKQVVINDNFEKDVNFSYNLINDCEIEERNKLNSFFKLFKIVQSFRYKKIVYGGYNDFENQLLFFLTNKKRNCLQFESSIKESKLHGIFFIVKKIFSKRFSCVLTSGKLQSDVFKKLKFKGEIIETQGVGIFNYLDINKLETTKDTSGNFVYVYIGRLIEIKNLKFLIKVFNRLEDQLIIIGKGPLHNELKTMANKNITFTGFVDNKNLDKYLCNSHALILPSLKEPWGLVVEEAIYQNLPVLVSENVGCQFEIVNKPKTGIVFELNEKSLLESIVKLKLEYKTYQDNCKTFSFKKRDMIQIDSYVNLVI